MIVRIVNHHDSYCSCTSTQHTAHHTPHLPHTLIPETPRGPPQHTHHSSDHLFSTGYRLLPCPKSPRNSPPSSFDPYQNYFAAYFYVAKNSHPVSVSRDKGQPTNPNRPSLFLERGSSREAYRPLQSPTVLDVFLCATLSISEVTCRPPWQCHTLPFLHAVRHQLSTTSTQEL